MGKITIECDVGEVSDGYHTFNELYAHRCSLFAALTTSYKHLSWKSRFHYDNSSFEGWFIAGMDLPSGTVTYSTAGVTPLMSDTWMAKQFPLQMGSFGSQPTVAIPGVDYCLFRFVLKTTTQDISAANHYNDYLAEVEFYVNSAAGAGYTAWLNAMSVLMPDCDTWS